MISGERMVTTMTEQNTGDYSRLKEFRYMLFDFDGTIGDSNTAYERFCRELFLEQDLPFPGFDEELKTADFDTMCSALFTMLGKKLPEEEIRRRCDRFLHNFYSHEVPPMPGALEFISFLQRQGTRMCVITATPRRLVDPAIAHLGLTGCFENVISPEMAGNRDKSHPDIFRRAMELMGHPVPEDYCLLDDSVTAVKTAKVLGMFTAGVYDSTSDGQKEQMQQVCDLFLPDFRCIDL